MRKHIAIGSAFALVLGVSACAAPADDAGADGAEEAAATDGTMTGEASADDAADTPPTGLDEDGNPIHD